MKKVDSTVPTSFISLDGFAEVEAVKEFLPLPIAQAAADAVPLG